MVLYVKGSKLAAVFEINLLYFLSNILTKHISIYGTQLIFPLPIQCM